MREGRRKEGEGRRRMEGGGRRRGGGCINTTRAEG